jgi:hypothetical protein
MTGEKDRRTIQLAKNSAYICRKKDRCKYSSGKGGSFSFSTASRTATISCIRDRSLFRSGDVCKGGRGCFTVAGASGVDKEGMDGSDSGEEAGEAVFLSLPSPSLVLSCRCGESELGFAARAAPAREPPSTIGWRGGDCGGEAPSPIEPRAGFTPRDGIGRGGERGSGYAGGEGGGEAEVGSEREKDERLPGRDVKRRDTKIHTSGWCIW